MKKLTMLFLLLCSLSSFAQRNDYKVIFDVTSKDPHSHQTVIREINGIKELRPDANLEVAIYSDALDMVLKDKSNVRSELEDLMRNKKATVKGGGFTMKRSHVEADQLIPGVKMVPDAIYEIITRQKEGWGYIKVAQ